MKWWQKKVRGWTVPFWDMYVPPFDKPKPSRIVVVMRRGEELFRGTSEECEKFIKELEK